MQAVIDVFNIIYNILEQVIGGFLEFFNTIPELFSSFGEWFNSLFPPELTGYLVAFIPIIVTLIIIKFVRG